MRYAILNGSPHKGNTWKLALQAIETICISDKQAVFDEIHLIEKQLPFCVGCSVCFRHGHEKCPHFTVIGEIIRKIECADAVIVLSSTYNLRETALLKNLFDHLCFMLHRPHFFKSKALVLTTTGGVGAKHAAKSICSFLTGVGFNRCYYFAVPAYSWNNYQMTIKSKVKLEKIVNRFQKDIASKVIHDVALLPLIPYNLFRGMSQAYAAGTEYETYDGYHWTRACRKSNVYDSDVPVAIYKKPIGQLFYWIGKMAGGKFVVTYRK